ncbi:hypothetical protein BC834DRAFT_210610 [Gloeopeniophorella convolvens]|nr:hypothetical protein BC834DRAFT_210610 [Gloeopeniophorella convolvens]
MTVPAVHCAEFIAPMGNSDYCNTVSPPLARFPPSRLSLALESSHPLTVQVAGHAGNCPVAADTWLSSSWTRRKTVSMFHERPWTSSQADSPKP